MAKEFEEIIELAGSEVVQLSESFKDDVNKSLCLGMTRYVCRYGTLGDGHEHITPAQRFFQAKKEMWYRGVNIRQSEIDAKKAQADYLDGKGDLIHAEMDHQELNPSKDKEVQGLYKDAKILKAQAKVEQGKLNLQVSLVNAHDSHRQLDEFHRVYKELKPLVEKRYPEGIEQAEPDNWKAVLNYRMHKSLIPGQNNERTDNIPLPPEEKAVLGVKYNRPEMVAPLKVENDWMTGKLGPPQKKLNGSK